VLVPGIENCKTCTRRPGACRVALLEATLPRWSKRKEVSRYSLPVRADRREIGLKKRVCDWRGIFRC